MAKYRISRITCPLSQRSYYVIEKKVYYPKYVGGGVGVRMDYLQEVTPLRDEYAYLWGSDDPLKLADELDAMRILTAIMSGTKPGYEVIKEIGND